jgi:hypothetical protein
MLASHSTSGDTSSYYEELRQYLDIPSFLAERSERSLHFSYQKYKTFLITVKTLNEKWKDGVLSYERKPSQEHIIKTMQLKTFWYDYIHKYFTKVGEHPDMVAWLENNDDAPSDIEVWGVEKKSYSFGDLDQYLKSGGVGLSKMKKEKSKGKEKARSSKKGKEKKKKKKKKLSKKSKK